MKPLPYPVFTGFYFLIAFLAIISEIFGLTWAYYLTKPVPLLIIYLFFRFNSQKSSEKTFRNLLLTAFLLSAGGDAVLMFSGASEYFFIAGLVLFLGAHVLYSIAFIREIFSHRPWNQHWLQLAFSTLVVVYGAEFFVLNRDHFGPLLIPVMIYCLAITTMGVSATMRDLSNFRNSYFKVICGAVLFIVSDSLLATNKFIAPFHFAATAILGTYFVAQYLIAVGCLETITLEKESGEKTAESV